MSIAHKKQWKPKQRYEDTWEEIAWQPSGFDDPPAEAELNENTDNGDDNSGAAQAAVTSLLALLAMF